MSVDTSITVVGCRNPKVQNILTTGDIHACEGRILEHYRLNICRLTADTASADLGQLVCSAGLIMFALTVRNKFTGG